MNAIIGVAIGLVLLFIVTAVIVSSVTEIVAWIVQMRARKLEVAVAKLVGENGQALTSWLKDLKPSQLDGDDFSAPAPVPPGPPGADPIPLARAVYQHPLISATMTTTTRGSRVRRPSYMDAKNFASALLATIPTTYDILEAFITDPTVALDAVKDFKLASDPNSTLGPVLGARPSAPDIAAAVLDRVQQDDQVDAVTACLPSDPTSVVAALAPSRPRVAEAITVMSAGVGGNARLFAGQLVRAHQRIPSDAQINDLGVPLIEAVGNPRLRAALLALHQRAADDALKFRQEVEDWFDREMGRVSGWYSKWAQLVMIVTGLVVAVMLNLSAYTIGRALWVDPTVRDKVAAAAEQLVPATTTASTITFQAGTTTTTSPPATTAAKAPTYDDLKGYGLPLGWSKAAWPGFQPDLILHILGWIAVAIAASFGAPFWFDALNKLVNLRTSGAPPPPAADTRAPKSPSSS